MKYHVVNVRMTEDTYQTIKVEAKKKHVTISKYIRTLLNIGLQHTDYWNDRWTALLKTISTLNKSSSKLWEQIDSMVDDVISDQMLMEDQEE